MGRYSGFTIVELVIVMAIMIILFSLVFGALNALLNANSVNEATLTITQDIRRAQRSAMMVERRSDDRWLYGYGLDFGNITDEDNPSYSVFKLCAEESSFDRNEVGHTSDVPRNDFNIDVNYGVCNDGNRDEVWENVKDVSVAEHEILDFELDNGEILLFQAVTGKAFIYDVGRDLQGYDDDDIGEGEWSIDDNDFEPLELEIQSHTGVSERVINIYPVSGVIHVDNLLHRED